MRRGEAVRGARCCCARLASGGCDGMQWDAVGWGGRGLRGRVGWQIVDLGEMSPMVQHLFMVRRAVYVYVWKIQVIRARHPRTAHAICDPRG